MASPKHLPFTNDLFFGATATSHNPSTSRASSHPDEGYSEEPRSMDASDSEMMYSQDPEEALARLFALAFTLPQEQRVNLIRRLIETVSNAGKENVGKYCVELTHFDPAAKLPNELMFSVLSYLSPKELLACGMVSSMWRERAQDDKLWRCCFAREGWVVDRSKLDRYEERARQKGHKYVDGVRRSKKPTSVQRHSSRKRKQGDAFSDGEGRAPVPEATNMHGITSGVGERSDSMEGIERTSAAIMSPADALMDVGRSEHSVAPTSAESASPAQSSSSFDSAIQQDHQQFDPAPKLFRPGPADQPKLSWPYVYKQRVRLEKNWETEGANKMFCLPHPKYPLEGHTECVYTIQHTTRHLVSGSRDKSIRKWDLATCRLIGEPMLGHEASVLCLQYDERPEQDIIVSGGSDARVIIWKFSTGKIVKNIEKAHTESVLNLRFDDHYIVTCSKDKTIKVWNRKQLAKDDPLIPTHKLEQYASMPGRMSAWYIAPFTELAELRGHQAAVNAVMIHENTIISASGDRTIKSWDIRRARLNKQYVGHLKGIACVQFDGRRIVSGSSDNTVRIFDAEHQAEVACLTGHGNLVRTVQARFGDLDTVTDAELESEARRADDGFYRALENGLSPASASRGAMRNAGSSRPEDMLTVGAKVPPGGGGTRWAKIVSGSYDESIIIWKRNHTGRWVKKLTLKQDELLNHYFPHDSRSRQPRIPYMNHGHLAPLPQPHGAQQQGQGQGNVNVQGHGPQGSVQQPTPQMQNAIDHITQLSQALQANAQAGNYGTNVNVTLHAMQGQNANPNHPPPPAAAPAPQPAANHIGGPASAAPGGNQAPAAPPAPAAPVNNGQPAAQHPHAANAAQQHRSHAGESNRIFKLQFDARRIICCSQNKIIVGWDFANGDKDLERVGDWSVETA